ncbi:MAG: CCE_0567 family metalloprotein [Methylovulum miyakonense]|uniref:CCE_0567 family metalloprotein n=1 Tax=Methylovulum miyakonense TaxID=645578 RepID=UPI003BB54D1C
MSEEDIRQLEKEVKKTKRLASEQAMELHDLIEDRLPDAYGELLGIANATYVACKNWDEANKKLQAAQAELA